VFYSFVRWLRNFVSYEVLLPRPSKYSLCIVKILIYNICIIFYQFKMGGPFDIIYFLCNVPPASISTVVRVSNVLC
jgi:hypothetical protein